MENPALFRTIGGTDQFVSHVPKGSFVPCFSKKLHPQISGFTEFVGYSSFQAQILKYSKK